MTDKFVKMNLKYNSYVPPRKAVTTVNNINSILQYVRNCEH